MNMNSEFNCCTLNTVYVDPTAEKGTVELLANIFNGIAYIDPDTVRYNIECASEGGFSIEDRTISVELANWIMNNFPFIFIGLIVNNDFRDTFIEAVSIELALDEKSDDFIASIRKEMNGGIVLESKSNFILNLGTYNDKIYRMINAELAKSFDNISVFNDTIDELIAALTDDNMIDIGYCVSNFAYLFRAFSKNSLFMNYTKSVVDSVKNQLKIV